MRVRLLVLVTIFLLAASVHPRERSFRLITFYYTGEHSGAGTQNFDVIQDDRGLIYVGNLAGVLEYDGVRWRVISLPHEAPALRLKIVKPGVIAVGSAPEFGYLERDATGTMQYVSLVKQVPKDAGDLEQIVQLDVHDGVAIYSFSSGVLLRWDGKSLTRIGEPDPSRTTLAVGNGDVITLKDLRTIRGNELVPIPNTSFFGGKRVRHVLPLADGKLLVWVSREGLFLFDGSSITPFAPQLSQQIRRDAVADMIPLTGGRIAVVTRRQGIQIVRQDGSVEEAIDAGTGLPDSDINHGFVDADGALWLAMDNGLSRVDVSSPFSLIDTRGGLRGSVESLLRFKGVLYAGTTSGLYRITTTPEGKLAEQIGAEQRLTGGWSLVSVGNDILCGANDAVYVVHDGTSVERLEATDSTTPYAMVVSSHDPNLVYAGTDRGLLMLRRTENGWTSSGLLPDSPPMIRTITEEDDGSLWLGTSFNGVSHATFRPKPQFKQYGKDAVYPVHLAGRLVFLVDSKRVCTLDARGRFTMDPILGSIGEGDEISAIAEDREKRIWASSRSTGVGVPSAGGKYRFVPKALAAIPGTSVDVILPEEDGVIWFGSERGLVRFDSHSQDSVAAAPREPLLRGVTLEGKPVEMPRNVPFGRARLRFDVSAASYDPGTMYQYRLDPVDESWGPWTDEPFTEFRNLWEGDYRLLVRTKNIRGAVSSVVKVPFHVSPPWYRTPLAWIAWLVIAIAGIGILLRLRTRALRRRARMLEKEVAERTHELQDAVERLRIANVRLEELSFDDPLTGIANRRQFDETLRAEWSRARRAQTPLALIFIDIDWFKALNDSRGHQVGDQYLRAVADYLSSSAQRSGDLVSRYGGEEFALVLPNTELAAAAQFAERLRNGIEELSLRHDAAPGGHLTASFGVVSVIPDGDWTPADAVAAADRALYMAKAEGRNRVEVAA